MRPNTLQRISLGETCIVLQNVIDAVVGIALKDLRGPKLSVRAKEIGRAHV